MFSNYMAERRGLPILLTKIKIMHIIQGQTAKIVQYSRKNGTFYGGEFWGYDISADFFKIFGVNWE